MKYEVLASRGIIRQKIEIAFKIADFSISTKIEMK
jgi:hypothetical protein